MRAILAVFPAARVLCEVPPTEPFKSHPPTGFANYVQAACHCRPGFMCAFCRRYLLPRPGGKRGRGRP